MQSAFKKGQGVPDFVLMDQLDGTQAQSGEASDELLNARNLLRRPLFLLISNFFVLSLVFHSLLDRIGHLGEHQD